jgi:serine protease
MYIILWGYTRRNDIDHLHKLLKNYGENIGGSSHNNIYTQYYMGSGPSQAFITNPSNQFGGIWVDHSSIPASPSQPQIAAEALSGVAHFGYDPQGSYVVATAHEHNQAGFGSQFCAYHGYTLTTTSQLVSYTNLPYMPDAGFSCGSKIIPAPLDERGKDEGVTIVEGHEYGESVTDDAEQAPNGLAWYNYSYGEIGDMCAWWDIQNDTFGLKSYASQPMFSNATTSCVQTY